MTAIQHKGHLLAYLIEQLDAGKKDWFNFRQQKVAGVNLAYEMALRFGDKMTPEEIADYVNNLNNAIYKIIVSEK